MTDPPAHGAPRGLSLGTFGGVPVRMAPTWPIFAGIIIVYFGPQVARLLPELGHRAYLVAAVYALLLLVSVLGHEAAHAIAARACGYRVLGIVVDLFGGHTTYEALDRGPGRVAGIAVAGPAVNGLLALLGWMALPLVSPGVPWLLTVAFVVTNALVGVFNLLPGHPLDGGHVLDALVWKLTGDRARGMIVAAWAGRVLVLALVLWVVLVPLAQGSPPSLFVLAWAGLIGALLWSGATQALRAGQAMRSYTRVELSQVLRPAAVVPAELALAEVAAELRRAQAPTGVVVLVRDASGDLLGVLAAPDELPADLAIDVPAAAVTARMPAGWVFEASSPPSVHDVVDRMHESGSRLIAVRTTGRLAGVVLADDVRTALGARARRP